MFAAASDVDNTSSIDLLAVKRGHSIMCFGAVAAFSQPPETEPIFIQAPADHRAKIGQLTVWQCLKCERAHGKEQERGKITSLTSSKECPGTFKQSLKSPPIFHASESEIALDLHVDDTHVTGPPENMKKVFAYLETKIVLKFSPSISVGSSFEHVGTMRAIDDEGMWVRELDNYELSVLSMMKRKDCRPSTGPKLEKQTDPGDDP